MATLALDDLEIHYELLGQGPRLLVFNGSGATIASARLLIDFLARSFEVLVHDQRGLGLTGLPSSPASFTMAAYAADGAALLDHLGWATARIFGISFGGMVAQQFAVTWPARVERLALLCTSPGGDGGSSYPLHELEGMAPEERERVRPRLLDTRFSPRWLSTHPSDMALLEQARAREAAPMTAEQSEGARLQLRPAPGTTSARALRGSAARPSWPAGAMTAWRRRRTPRRSPSGSPGASCAYIEGGHLFILQDPRALAEIVTFLSG